MSPGERRRKVRDGHSGDRHARVGRRARGLYFKTAVEWLEPRCMLSAQAITGIALPTVELAHVNGSLGSATPATGSTSPPSGAYSPTQILNAYNFNQVTFSGGAVQGNGAGQTIAIIDAYLDPNIAADAATFSTNYSLPQFGATNGPTLTITNESGGSVSSLSTDPSGDDWALETSLNVEWIHALVPKANILLVETNSDSLSDLLVGVKFATTQPNVSVVSMSWGSTEAESELNDDSIFTTPAGHQGITFVSSAGDTGTPGGYPAYSPNVLAVGGTNLQLSGGNYSSETVWNDGQNPTTLVYEATGGGVSAIEAEPAYQDSVVPTTDSNGGHNRAMPDVAFDADPNSGVAIVDSYDYGSGTGWVQVGGTSFGAPAWAAIVAIADQGRATEGLGTLDGASQTLPDIYAMPSTNFHDITSGSNGTYSATTGYDLVTGRGTPIVSSIVGYFDNASLAQIAVVSTSPAATSSVAVPMTSLTVEFNEAYAASSISTSNLTLSEGSVTGFTLINPTTVTYSLSGLTSTGSLTVSIAAGAITNINGGAGAAFSANETLASSGIALPAGSLVYEASVAGTFTRSSRIIQYTLNIAAGETITALLIPGTLPFAKVLVTGPASSFPSQQASGSGQDVVLQTLAATISGTYTFSLITLNGDTGSYTFDVFLNAAVSTSAIGLASNNQYTAAQNIAAAFEATGPSAMSAAVVGVTNGLSNGSLSDYYAVTLAAGQTVTLAATDQSGAAGTINVSLLNSSGTTVATGTPMTTNVDGAVENFTATTAGTYFVDVTGVAANITYVLVVTRGADFDLKGNSTQATAQNISGTDGVLGTILSSAPTDWYAVNLAAGASVSLQTCTFGGNYANSDDFIDGVQPQIQLYSPTGTLIASGTGSPNQSLVANASAAGTYYIEVTGGSGSLGEYFLGISTAPTVSITSISPNPTNAAVSQMQIVFDGPVSGMSLADLSLSLNGGPNLLTGSQTLTTTDDKTFTLNNLASLTGANGVYTLTVAANSGIANQNGIALQNGASTTFTVDTNPPEVTGVYVSSTAWSQTFLNYLASEGLGSATLGYQIPAGSNQTTDIPWVNINTISVVFNENVVVTNNSALQLLGSPNGPTFPALSTAAFTNSGNTAQWTFSSPLATDKYLLSIPSANVTDLLGSTLDGEWTTSSSAYPSGNGVAGGNFNFLFNILQGDANQDGAVTGTDGNGVRPLLLQNTTNSSYSPYYDLVGSGTITGIDGSYVRVNLTDTLPATGPSIPGGGSVVTAVSPSGTTGDGSANSLTGGTNSTPGQLSTSSNSSTALTLGDFAGAEPLYIGELPSNSLAAGSSQTGLRLVTVTPAAGTSSAAPTRAAGSTAVEGNSVPSSAALDSLFDSSPLNFGPEQARSPLAAESIASAANFEAPITSFAAAHESGFADPNGDLNRSSMGDSSEDPFSADSDGGDRSRGDGVPAENWLTDLILEQEFDWLDF